MFQENASWCREETGAVLVVARSTGECQRAGSSIYQSFVQSECLFLVRVPAGQPLHGALGRLVLQNFLICAMNVDSWPWEGRTLLRHAVQSSCTRERVYSVQESLWGGYQYIQHQDGGAGSFATFRLGREEQSPEQIPTRDSTLRSVFYPVYTFMEMKRSSEQSKPGFSQVLLLLNEVSRLDEALTPLTTEGFFFV